MRPTFLAIAATALMFSPTANAERTGASTPQPAVQTKTPVGINIPADTLAALTPEERQTVEAVKATIESELWSWDRYDLELPETVFTKGTTIVRLDDLFVSPDRSELGDLARGADGKLKKLTPEQIESIRDDALLVVPSIKYPGQNHVWKVALWLQKGRKNIEITLKKGKDLALSQITVELPNRWRKGNFVSVRTGLTNMYKGFIRGTLDSLVGLVDKKPRYSDAEVTNIISQQAAAEVKADLSQPSFTKAYDLRLYNDELMEKVIPVLANIAKVVDTQWQAQQTAIAQELIVALPTGLSIDEQSQQIKQKLEAARLELYYKVLKTNPELEAVSPDIGELLVSRDLAIRMAMDVEEQINNDLAQYSGATEASLRATGKTVRVHRMTELIALMRTKNLGQEADILEKTLQFYTEKAEAIAANLSPQEVAERVFTLQNRIWFARNWIKHEVETEQGAKNYFADTYETSEVSTGNPFWRIALAAQRYRAILKTANYGLIVQNLWNGPVGVKSLVKGKRFTPWMKMDPNSGKLVIDETKDVDTLMQRHGDIWRSVNATLAEFERRSQGGFISKDTLRPFYYAMTKAKGAAATAALWFLQPLFTVANVGVSGTLAATSPAWALATSVLWWGFDAALFDTSSPYTDRKEARVLPIVQNLLLRGGGGALQLVGGLIGTVAHPIAGGVIYLSSESQAKVRTLWDAIMANVFLTRADMPIQDTTTIKRIAGPDINRDYYYQIQPELAILALRASLERVELDAYEAYNKEKINEPYKSGDDNLRRVFEKTLGVTILSSRINDGAVLKRAEGLLKTLGDLLKARREDLPVITNLNGMNAHIRMKNADLQRTVQAGTPVVEKFWSEKIKPLLADQELASWNSFGLAKDNFAGLTLRLLQTAFGTGFSTAIEEEKPSFVIQVGSPNYNDFVDRILDGKPISPELIAGQDRVQYKSTDKLQNLNFELSPAKRLVDTTVSYSACRVLLRKPL